MGKHNDSMWDPYQIANPSAKPYHVDISWPANRPGDALNDLWMWRLRHGISMYWCTPIRATYRRVYATFYFDNPSDAILFKLEWG